MRFEDFCLCTPEELEEIFRAFREMRESDHHGNWERMRLLAAMVMQPHCKRKLIPEKLLPFPWEKKRKRNPVPDREEARTRLENLLNRHTALGEDSMLQTPDD